VGGGGAGGKAAWSGTPATLAAAGTTNTGGGGGAPDTAGGSGIVILRIPNLYTATFSAGLTVTTSNTAVTGYRVYSVTAGTGTVTFN
jgi:hypothetical protein